MVRKMLISIFRANKINKYPKAIENKHKTKTFSSRDVQHIVVRSFHGVTAIIVVSILITRVGL